MGTTSNLPDELKVIVEKETQLREEKESQSKLDLELVLKSANPEIQAICRLLGWKK